MFGAAITYFFRNYVKKIKIRKYYRGLFYTFHLSINIIILGGYILVYSLYFLFTYRIFRNNLVNILLDCFPNSW